MMISAPWNRQIRRGGASLGALALMLGALVAIAPSAGAVCGTPQDGRYLGTWEAGALAGVGGSDLVFSGSTVSGTIELITGTTAVVPGTPITGTLTGCDLALTAGGVILTGTVAANGAELGGSFDYSGTIGTWRVGRVTERSTTGSTGGGGTPADPLGVQVVSPTGGVIVIDEAISTGGSFAGYSLFDTVVRIEAPAASSDSPLQLTFTIDSSKTGGAGAAGVAVFRNGLAVPNCTGAPQALPDPCVSSRLDLGGGDLVITVLTSQASTWNFGAIAPPPDSTPPVITPSVSGLLGDGGWYVGDVTVSWTVVDPNSAVSSASGCATTVITIDTTGTMFTCSATSAGGSSSVSVSVARDATPPTLTPTVTPSPVLLHGAAAADPGAIDVTSGLVSSGCDAVETSSVGAKSIACTATDAAGNLAVADTTVNVTYGFVGFSSPVDGAGVLNRVKAGRAIPLKWRLVDANGAPVTDVSSATLTAPTLSCGRGTTFDDLEETAAAGSGLQNLGNGYYQLNWKTPTYYSDSCKTATLDLGEGGVVHTALFEFTR